MQIFKVEFFSDLDKGFDNFFSIFYRPYFIIENTYMHLMLRMQIPPSACDSGLQLQLLVKELYGVIQLFLEIFFPPSLLTISSR